VPLASARSATQSSSSAPKSHSCKATAVMMSGYERYGGGPTTHRAVKDEAQLWAAPRVLHVDDDVQQAAANTNNITRNQLRRVYQASRT
jgi:hypothetical protein